MDRVHEGVHRPGPQVSMNLMGQMCADLGSNCSLSAKNIQISGNIEKKKLGLISDIVPSQFFLLNRFFGSISYMAAILTGSSEASNLT